MRKRITQELEALSVDACANKNGNEEELLNATETLAASWGPRTAGNVLANIKIDPKPQTEWWEFLSDQGRNSRDPSPGNSFTLY